ncbi:MAG: beta/gamma crystallin-related protein [Chloroflexi bacterium]|nr:beta/gamma crystallin-related protein [Chloroflexota bacterium]
MTKILNETHQHGFFFSTESQGNDLLKIAIPPDEIFHSCRLTILDSHFGGSAKLVSSPSFGQVGSGEIVVSWLCSDNAEVKYQLEAFSCPNNAEAKAIPVTRQMTDFLPSRNGWPFDNSFEAVPPFKLIGELRYGDASKGLCGGMVYAALDYFLAGLNLPQVADPDISVRYKSPLHGPIFDYLSKRLFNSFDIPAGVWNYIELMNPSFPDFQTSKSRLLMAPRNRAWRMVRQEWPVIKTKLDTGQPCPLGLIRIKSSELSRLGENHQVLAYGYDLKDDDLTLFIYDPNFHNNDNVTLKLNIGNPERKTSINYFDNKPVECFFQPNYTFTMPPDSNIVPGRIILFEDENFCGKSIDVMREQSDLSVHKAGNFDNCTSSFVILSGKWSFYLKASYDTPVMHKGSPLVLAPGSYAKVSDLGILDNEITSLKAVNK